jgi:hypothetical protein
LTFPAKPGHWPQFEVRGAIEAMRYASIALVGLGMAAFGAPAVGQSLPPGCRLGPDAQCAGANLEGRDMRGANLRRANLKGAKLRGANLAGADLGGADLTEADMRFVNMGGVALFGTKLSGANLKDAGLRYQDLKSDTEISRAIMPDGKMCAEGSIGDCRNPTVPPPARR